MLMKLTKLFVSGAAFLILGGAVAQAEVVDGVRLKPVPAKSALQYGEVYYLYNVGSQKYFLGANDWSTRASVGDQGWNVRLSQYVEDGAEWDNKTVLLEDSVLEGNNKGKWLKSWFTTSTVDGVTYLDGGLYTDYNGQSDYFWTILPQANDVYRFAASEKNPNYKAEKLPNEGASQLYVGFDKTLDGDTRLYAFLEADNAVDWYFVTEEAYQAQQALLPAYNAAQALKEQIDIAKGKGIDVAAWTAIYENEASTIEALNAATKEAKEAITKADESSVTPENPVDKTSLLQNPGYESTTGWSGDIPGLGYGCAEFYNKTYNGYQKVSGASNGVYAVQLQAFYRAGWCANSYANYNNGNANALAKLYAISGADTLDVSVLNAFADARDSRIGVGSEMNEAGSTTDGGVAFIPNNMQAAAAYFEDGRYKGNVVFFAVDNGEFQVGLQKTTKLDGDWTLFDNWTLTYYGNTAAAFKLWQDEFLKTAFDASTISPTATITKGLVEAYNALKANLSSPSNKAEALANINSVKAAAAGIQANLEAWAALEAAIKAAQATIVDKDIADGPLKDELADKVYDYEDYYLGINTQATEEVVAFTQELLALTDNVIKNSIKVGSDVTDKFLVNARYENGATGWEGSPTVNGPADNKCAEKFNTAFDVYQIVADAPVGVYSVSLQGFYRPGDNIVAWPIYQEQNKWTKATTIGVYVNNNTSALKNIYDVQTKKGELFLTEGLVGPKPFEAKSESGDSIWFVNDMTNAGIAFAQELYTSTAFGLVAQAGDVLRIGIKGELDNANQWVCWDNFKMVYEGFNADIIKPELVKSVANAKSMLNSGMTAPVSYMSKTAFEGLKSAIAAGETAVAGTDGKVMFDALSGLFSAIEKANASIVVVGELYTAAEELLALASDPSCPADAATKADAMALYSEIAAAVEECTIEDADVEAYLAKVAEMRIKLNIPSGTASDNNPLNYTGVIQTPSFSDSEGNNSLTGWENTKGYNFGNDATQKSALLLEFYEKENVNMYQDISPLPNGTYSIHANAFCRLGSSDNDAAAYQANPDTLSHAYIYGTSNDVTSAVGISLRAKDAIEGGLGVGSEQDVTIGGVAMKVPNDMVSANAYFEAGKYENKVVVKVTDGKLRIGVRKDQKLSGDWLIIDNFRLYYYGENSAQTPDGDASGVESINGESNVAKVEFFNLNGTRTARIAKGLNIVKTTMKDGSVVVTKTIVK